MKGDNCQEDEELEMLLGEIPNATSAANLHVEEFGVNNSSMSLASTTLTEKTMGKTFCSDSLNDYYLASQTSMHSTPSVSFSPVPAVTCSSYPSFCNGLNLSSHSSINSATKDIINRKPHSEDNLVGANSSGRKKYPKPVESAEGEENHSIIESKLPDVQKLTSAISNLRFDSQMSTGPTIGSSVQYKCLSNSALLMGDHFPTHMAREEPGLEEIVGTFPQSPNTETCGHFGNTAVETQGMMNVGGGTFPSILRTAAVDKFNGKVSREVNSRFLKLTHETERDKHYPMPCLPVDEFASVFGDQRQSLPIYSGPVQFPSGIQSFQVHPSVPVSGVEFPASVCQQQYYFNLQSSPLMQPQQYGHLNESIEQLNQCHMAWQHRDEESCRAAQQQYAHLQLQFQGIKTVNQLHPNSNGSAQSLSRNSRQPYCEAPISHVEHDSPASGLNDSMYPQRLSQPNKMLNNGCLSACSGQNFCGRSGNSLFVHRQSHTLASGFICLSNSSSTSKEDLQGIKVLEKEPRQNFPERILTKSHGVNALKNLKISYLPNEITVSYANSNGRPLADAHSHHHHPVPSAGLFILDGHNSRGSSPDRLEKLTPRSRQHLKCASLDEIEGRIYAFAKDQHGCRFLQEKFVEGTADDIQKIFVEIIDHVVELMTDPFGNYLVQKLLDVCSENQRIQILHAITRNAGILVNICLNMHGTRAVQKVIETLKTSEQITMVVSSLRNGAVKLIKDLNGNHVVQRCLQCLENQHNEFLFDAAAAHCVEIATHRHGCCVLQKCLYHSDGEQKQRLVSEVVTNALILAQDPFGNYVVQYVIELGLSWATTHVIDQLGGHFANLSTQKYSSNVVEKCLELAEEEKRALIIHELIDHPHLGHLLQDPFANYVVQSALANSKGLVHSAFVDAIKPHLPALRSNPYGKRIISCTNLKNDHVKSNKMEAQKFQLVLQNTVSLHQSMSIMTRR